MHGLRGGCVGAAWGRTLRRGGMPVPSRHISGRGRPQVGRLERPEIGARRGEVQGMLGAHFKGSQTLKIAI